MNYKFSKDWIIAAFIRMIRTIAQTALGMFTVGTTGIAEINWIHILSVSAVAGIYSFLTSIVTTLPEVGTDGTLVIDRSNPNKDLYSMELDGEIQTLGNKKRVSFKVTDNDAK